MTSFHVVEIDRHQPSGRVVDLPRTIRVSRSTCCCCYHFKGGSGTASRLVAYGEAAHVIGVLLQANFGARRELTIANVPVGAALAGDDPMEAYRLPSGAGSVIGIVVTDAPLLPNQCGALARRVAIGIGRTGTSGSHFSGDLFLAVSVANPGSITPGFRLLGASEEPAYDRLSFVPWGAMDPFFEAVVNATDEAVVNALVANEDMIGHGGNRSPGLPRDRVMDLLRAHGAVPW